MPGRCGVAITRTLARWGNVPEEPAERVGDSVSLVLVPVGRRIAFVDFVEYLEVDEDAARDWDATAWTVVRR